MADQMMGVSPPTSEPEEKEANVRVEKEGAEEEPQGAAGVFAGTPPADLDRTVRAGSPAPEQVLGFALDAEPVSTMRPGGLSPSDFLIPEEDLEEVDAQPDQKEERHDGGPEGHPDCQSGGA